MKKIFVSFLILSFFSSSNMAWAQAQIHPTDSTSFLHEKSDNSVPHVTIKDLGVDLQARVLVSIHQNERYNGLTFRWCTYAAGREDCGQYLGCRPAGYIYTFDELKYARHRLWRKSAAIVGIDTLLASVVIIASVYAARQKELAQGAAAIEKAAPSSVKELSTEALEKVGSRLVKWKDYISNHFAMIAGLSVVGISFSGFMAKFVSKLDPSIPWTRSQLIAWDLYSNAYANQVDITRELKDSAKELNTALCDIDTHAANWR